MRQVALSALVLTLGIGISAVGVQTARSQQATDPRVADLVQAGKVRAGLGLGSPALALKNPSTGAVSGPAWDLARALAERIGVEPVAVEYLSPGGVIEGARTNAWDIAFLVIDPNRAQLADFSHPYMLIDITLLVPAGSSIRTVADADQPGIRISVIRGSVDDLLTTCLMKRAELVRADTPAAALELLRNGQAHARPGPRPLLLQDAAKLPGFRVLEDAFAVLSYAVLVPKGHADRLAYINEFVEEAKASGLMKRTIEATGLQGMQVAPPGPGGSRGQ